MAEGARHERRHRDIGTIALRGLDRIARQRQLADIELGGAEGAEEDLLGNERHIDRIDAVDLRRCRRSARGCGRSRRRRPKFKLGHSLPLPAVPVIASEAKQSSSETPPVDCFVASLLAMTAHRRSRPALVVSLSDALIANRPRSKRCACRCIRSMRSRTACLAAIPPPSAAGRMAARRHHAGDRGVNSMRKDSSSALNLKSIVPRRQPQLASSSAKSKDGKFSHRFSRERKTRSAAAA